MLLFSLVVCTGTADGVHALNRPEWSTQLSRFKSRISALKKIVNDTQVRTSSHPREAGRLRSFSKTHASDLSQVFQSLVFELPQCTAPFYLSVCLNSVKGIAKITQDHATCI
jgi:hypothetical protein